MATGYPHTLLELERRFVSEQACLQYLLSCAGLTALSVRDEGAKRLGQRAGGCGCARTVTTKAR